MKTKLILFTLLVIILASCSNEARWKSKIKKAIIEKFEENDKDVTVRVSQLGELYPYMPSDSIANHKAEIIAKAGSKTYDMMKANAAVFGFVIYFGEGNVKSITQDIEQNSNAIKACGLAANIVYVTCHISIKSKLYNKKNEYVCGVMFDTKSDKILAIIRDSNYTNEEDS